ncbi:hypothetical protein ATCC90586_010121 [Pythium insidiosum]|nr:hypothetical protein ATCC90586_010121 [Pythium insidiosum]
MADSEDKAAAMATTSTVSSSPAAARRILFLRRVDSRKWHYTETLALFLDFLAQVLAVSFAPRATFALAAGSAASRAVSAALLPGYLVSTAVRLVGLRSSLWRSHSSVADLVCWGLTIALLVARYLVSRDAASAEYALALAYLVVVALRLILKPRARNFSKKLHKFRAHGDQIRISIESLRASVRRIPELSALAVELMETDLLIICGRDAGDMTRDELISFLERALLYRPAALSATEFLAHLRDIDASTSQVAYGTADVLRSTLSHWSNQSRDLGLCFLAVCVNASISPAMAFFLAKLTDAFKTLTAPHEGDGDLLRLGVVGIVGLCVPFVLGNFAVGYFQSKMISKATEHLQQRLLGLILRQDTAFFAARSEGDLNNLFSSDVARVNALWQAVFWNLLNPIVSIVFGFGYAMYIDASIGVMGFAFAAIFLSSGPQGFAAHRSKAFGSKNAYVAAEFQNAVACHKVVRAYAIQEPLLARFAATCANLRHHQFSKDFWSSVVQIYIESAMYIFTAIMTASLALKVWRYEIQPGDFFGFIALLPRVASPVTILGGFMRVAIGNASTSTSSCSSTTRPRKTTS